MKVKLYKVWRARMEFRVEKVGGIGDYREESELEEGELVRKLYKALPSEKAFLVVNKNTLEVRCDEKLAAKLREDYESVMMSRYFGKGGIEIVNAGQLDEGEINDLVRLSYNLTARK